ncbi:MAG TPA: hypothetical protein VHX38_16070 [Pseudonocardiaceae bacterium]|nr:hypothetical protein [Pseudonocardiaceae bacterium]
MTTQVIPNQKQEPPPLPARRFTANYRETGLLPIAELADLGLAA